MNGHAHDPLRPRFVGDDFADFVHPSLFGAFAMVVRLNQLFPKDYLAAFELRVRRADDLSRILTFSESRKQSVQTALGLPSYIGELGPWLPFTCDLKIFEAVWHFRYCLSCLRFGYHTLLHQLPWIHRCPWHGDLLRDTCRRCDRPMEVNGIGGRPLLQCVCGFEALNELATVEGDRKLPAQSGPFIESYLRWAAERRSRCQLFSPQGLAPDVSVLGEFIRLPPDLEARCQDSIHHRKYHTGRLRERDPPFDVDDLQSALAKLGHLDEDGSGVIEVPRQLERAFMKVGSDLANRLPPKTLTNAEMALFFDGVEHHLDGRFLPAKRKDIQDIAWLPTRLVSNRRFLSLRCVDTKVSRVASDLLAALAPGTGEDQRKAEATRSFGVRAVGRTLLRAYSEGIRTVIARHAPALFDTKRDRPHRTEAWAILEDDQAARRIRWIWVRSPELLD